MGRKKAFLIIVVILISIITVSYAQPAPRSYIPVVDSVRIKIGQWAFLDPKNLKDIKFVRNDPHYHTDVFYYTLKDHNAYFNAISGKFLSPDVIARKYIPGYNKNSRVIFFWNDKLLVDTAEAGVPERYFIRAEVIRTNKTVYNKTLPRAIFLKIYSKR